MTSFWHNFCHILLAQVSPMVSFILLFAFILCLTHKYHFQPNIQYFIHKCENMIILYSSLSTHLINM